MNPLCASLACADLQQTVHPCYISLAPGKSMDRRVVQFPFNRSDAPTVCHFCAAATGAVKLSPPESLTSSWNGPEAGAFGHHGPSVVPREPCHQDAMPNQASHNAVQHGRRQGRAVGSGSPSPAQSQELPQPRSTDASSGHRPDSAAYKAKVTPCQAHLHLISPHSSLQHAWLSAAVCRGPHAAFVIA